MKRRIGYVPIENFQTDKPKVCESPRHEGQNLQAFAALCLRSPEYPIGLVQLICKDCWEYFDRDLGSPNWNLLELRNERGR